MKLTSKQKIELVRKLEEAKLIAESLLLSTRQREPMSGLVDMYTKTIDAINRRIVAVQSLRSLDSVLGEGSLSQIGLYRGVSENKKGPE